MKITVTKGGISSKSVLSKTETAIKDMMKALDATTLNILAGYAHALADSKRNERVNRY